ncbi:sterol carrier family protein [Leifsonia sp. YIM 134122]|uniref:Sterol carrier family protein n=1 Tax=Leifsonia stereocauli TaxID=3134136 RepID=A0ABU9W6V2_9MICO
MGRARIDEGQGLAALRLWQADAVSASRDTKAMAVRFTLQALADRAPGNTVEVRVPPFGATQCIEGPRHTRGTPPNVIETDAATWLALATGAEAWDDALGSGRVHASGQRAQLDGLLPVVR